MRRDPLAVIDIGSNTIRSLIVEIQPDGTYRVLDDEREVARLASGLSGSGRLSDPAMRRAVKALGRMASIARARGVRRPAVVATSALRNASNQRAFVARVLKETGLHVQVISGRDEARLAFESAALSFDLTDRSCAVADVGGGSSEVILALGHNIQHIHSLPLGSVALTEEFIHSDPVRRREFKALRAAVRDRLREAGVAADQPLQVLIASGGTASSLAQILMALQGLPGRPSHGFEMTQAQLLHMREALLRRTLAQRRQIPGLSADRADFILAGATILYELLARLNVNVLRVSTRGIRHALLQRLITGRAGLSMAPARPRRLDAAVCFARTLRFEQKHGEHVQRIALALFDQLAGPLGLDRESRDLLAAAALLHDVGY
ncbi:MAG TPA: Ppx/GppA phosphatase family protein, partial [Candidatus Polarisedimenticolia bacterium]|nr:Ppx/GppA phosphatase family protein [Candidatus Polarisedimenticolia bacterium]